MTSRPAVRLAQLPTPLEAMDRLAAALGAGRLLVKRDDCTGLALGGNKARKARQSVRRGRRWTRSRSCHVTLV